MWSSRLARLVQLLLAASFLVDVCSCQGLSIIGPNTIRPNTPYSVSLVNTLTQNMQLRLSLLDDLDEIQQQTILLKKQTGKLVTFQPTDLPGGEYSLSVESLDHGFHYSERINLMFSAKVLSILIQTDKPVYKPGDLVRFRVVVVDADTRPVTGVNTISVGLTDSADNSIRQWPYAQLYKGVFESEVRLAPSPELGNWTLEVEAAGETATKRIELRKYELPQFSIKVYPAEVPLVERKSIKLIVQSAYTFGTPVTGSMTAGLYLDEIKRRPDYQKQASFDGLIAVEFQLGEEVDVDGESQYKDVLVNVSITDSFANRTLSILEPIRVYRDPYEVSVIRHWPKFRPGMPYPIKIALKTHDGEPADAGNTVQVKVVYSDHSDHTFEKTLDRKGMIALDLVPPAETEYMTLEVVYDSVTYDVFEGSTIEGVMSQSKQFIRISLPERYKVRPDKEVKFDITCSEPMRFISYILVSRGRIVDSSVVNVFGRKTYSLKYKLMPQLAPKATIIVSYTNKKYLIWDEFELNFETFQNHFNFTLDEDKYQPGQAIYVDVEADKDSYIAFQAIDQSALLLGADEQGISKQNVLNELNAFANTSKNEWDLFAERGLFLRTTLISDTPNGRLGRFGSSSLMTKKIIHIRTKFPESWLWQNHSMTGKDHMTFRDVVPDTITSWVVSGFALSPTTGLGVINQPLKFAVERSFYIVAHLPYSIKRGEATLVQVTIFNFLGNELITDVRLYNKNDEIEFLGSSTGDNNRRSKALVIPGSAGKQVSFLIKAKKLGEIALKIEAVNRLDSDSVEHILRVDPESILYEKDAKRFIDLPNHNSSINDVQIDIPRNVVDGSVHVKFNLDPSGLSQTIENLDNILLSPKHYGEGNMVDFVPAVVILDYLMESGKIDQHLQIKTKATNQLSNGYRNQLNYKNSDGSFRMWDSGKDSSILVTALAAKSFKIAAKHITVDKEGVQNAFEWLASKQNSDGSFKEVGDIIHTKLQGAERNTRYALTAYVLAAFLETKDIAEKHSNVVEKATQYLVTNINQISEDPYDLALTVHALSLKEHPRAKEYLQMLITTSEFSANHEYRSWNIEPVSIEITAYATLAILRHYSVLQAAPYVRWLSKNLSSRGGFYGAQETFVGLKAIAAFTVKSLVRANEYRVRLKYNKDQTTRFDVDSMNTLQVHTTDLPAETRQVNVEVTGRGTGIYQLAWQYHLDIEDARSSFNLDVELLASSDSEQLLKVCVNYIAKEAYQFSNLAYVEVYFPSGLIADEHAVREVSSHRRIKKTELRKGGTSVVVYYDKMGANDECFQVKAERRYKVALHRPAHVVVYDTVDKQRFAIKKYEGKTVQLCDICEDEECTNFKCDNQ